MDLHDYSSLDQALAETQKLANQAEGLDFFEKVLLKAKSDKRLYDLHQVPMPETYGKLLANTASENMAKLEGEIDTIIANMDLTNRQNKAFIKGDLDINLARFDQAYSIFFKLSNYLANHAHAIGGEENDKTALKIEAIPLIKKSNLARTLLSNAWGVILNTVPYPSEVWGKDLAKNHLDALVTFCQQYDLDVNHTNITELKEEIADFGKKPVHDEIYDICHYIETFEDEGLVSTFFNHLPNAVAYYESRGVKLNGTLKGLIEDYLELAMQKDIEILISNYQKGLNSIDCENAEFNPQTDITLSLQQLESTINYMEKNAEYWHKMDIIPQEPLVSIASPNNKNRKMMYSILELTNTTIDNFSQDEKKEVVDIFKQTKKNLEKKLNIYGTNSLDIQNINWKVIADNSKLYIALTLLKNARFSEDKANSRMYLDLYTTFTQKHQLDLNPEQYNILKERLVSK